MNGFINTQTHYHFLTKLYYKNMANLSIAHTKVDSSLDKICAYLQTSGKKPLSEPLQKRLDKIDFVDNLIRNGRSPKEISHFLPKRFPDEDISRATAYRIISDAKYVFGSISRTDKEYWRSVLVDLILETRKYARKENDLKTMAACEANLYKAMALDKDDPDLPSFDKIQPPIQILNVTNVFMEKYKGILPNSIMKEAKALNFEELKTADEERKSFEEEEEEEQYDFDDEDDEN